MIAEEILVKYEKQFIQIRDSNFCRLPSSTVLKELDIAYRQIFGKGSKLLNGCSNCIFQSLRELSIYYWDEKKNMVQVETEPENVNDSTTIKKKGRKKKIITD